MLEIYFPCVNDFSIRRVATMKERIHHIQVLYMIGRKRRAPRRHQSAKNSISTIIRLFAAAINLGGGNC